MVVAVVQAVWCGLAAKCGGMRPEALPGGAGAEGLDQRVQQGESIIVVWKQRQKLSALIRRQNQLAFAYLKRPFILSCLFREGE